MDEEVSNVIPFPKECRQRLIHRDSADPKLLRAEVQEIKKDHMDFILGIIITQLMDRLGEHGIDTDEEKFSDDLYYVNEALRGLLYRTVDLSHPFQKLAAAYVALGISSPEELKVSIQKIREETEAMEDEEDDDDPEPQLA